MLKHLDCELIKMLESSAPPCDLSLVSSFRAALQKHTKKAGSTNFNSRQLTEGLHVVSSVVAVTVQKSVLGAR